MLDLEKVPGSLINKKYLEHWDVGGRKLVLGVSLSWHTKIQEPIRTNKELSHSCPKKRVSPKVMTFLTLEVSEQEFKQSLGRDLGKHLQILYQFVQNEF